MNNISEILFKLRRQSKLPKTKVASELGISYSAYNLYESGKRKPDLEVLLKACQFYNVPQSYFNIDSNLTGIGNNGYYIKNTDTSEVLEVTADEFEMLKGVLAAYRKK